MKRIFTRVADMKCFAASRYATGYRRTMDHLLNWKPRIPEHVTDAIISFKSADSKTTELRLFVSENVPQMKFHNPHLKVLIRRRIDQDSVITWKSEAGIENTSIVGNEMTAFEIKEMINSMDWSTFFGSESSPQSKHIS